MSWGQTGEAASGGDPVGRYDHVTRLPNRVQFLEQLRAVLSDLGGGGSHRTLVLVTIADARHFNAILRALGHGFSEAFIRAGAARIAAGLDAHTQLFNVSVLSFAFLLPAEASPEAVAAELHRRFAEPLRVQNIPVQSNIGVGCIRLENSAADPAETLRAALTAAQDSRNGRVRYAYYDPRSDAAQRRTFQILTDLPTALERGDQLCLFYQPRIELATGRCVSAEALIRWHHPELGWISPGEFMPLVETTALIEPLTAYVLDEAARQVRVWRDAGRTLKVSVNLSPENLSEPDFLDKVTRTLNRHGVAPADLEMEFTESAISPDNATVTDHLNQVRGMGIEVAIDDFGSGYSNMAYLTNIPADIVKIDKSFVLSLDTNAQDRFLARQIAELAHGLDFAVVAEGVESPWAYTFLTGLGCREAQGFYLSKPIPPGDLEAWLDRRGSVRAPA